MAMRTFIDWRDLPPVPRIGAQKVAAPASDIGAAAQSNSECKISLKRKQRPESNTGGSDSDNEEELIVPRKRTRCAPKTKHSAVDKRVQERSLQVDKHSEKPLSSDSASTKGANDSQSAASKERTGSPLSDGNTSLSTDDESSDERAALRVIRRQCKHSRTGRSSNGVDRSPSRFKCLQPARRGRGCASDQPDQPCRSATKSRKRHRSSSPVNDRDEGGEVLKRRRQSERTVSRPRKDSREALLAEVSPVSNRDSIRERSRTGGSGQRRCARRSTGSVSVPWYLLDEERRPRRLRSSSRNCAARCVYWTRTEHRMFCIGKSPIHNRGLYACEDIPAFVPVIEYAGEVITQVQSEIREWAYQTRHMDEVYMYQLRKGTTNVIDGTLRGGPAKFVNHSCEPNVVAEEIHAGGTNRVWFFSLRPIRKSEEILVDYCLKYEVGDVKRPCKCRARTCKKFLNYYGLTE